MGNHGTAMSRGQNPGGIPARAGGKWIKQTKSPVADGTWRKYHDEAKRFALLWVRKQAGYLHREPM
jgi:hypothetical protein